jgi:hypothetical protein
MLTTLTHCRHHLCHQREHSLLLPLALQRALSSSSHNTHNNSHNSSHSSSSMLGVPLVAEAVAVLTDSSSSSSKEGMKGERELKVMHREGEGTNHHTRSVLYQSLQCTSSVTTTQ